MKTLTQILFDEVQILRKKGLNVTQIAKAARINQATLSLWLRQKTGLSLKTADKLYFFIQSQKEGKK